MSESKIPYKIYLSEAEMPTAWYNLRADMRHKPAPLLHPGTHRPMTHADLAPVFCDELIEQELDDDTRYFPIPQEILDFYKMYRPSPLVRAYCLEKALDTPAKIYYKRQPQAQFRDRAGVLREKAGSARRDHGNRRRTMGDRPLDGVRLSRTGLQGLHGQGLL